MGDFMSKTTSDRRRYHSGAPWEPICGYCRAIRIGAEVVVGGTVAIDADGSPHAPGDPYAQTRRCLEIISEALAAHGASLRDVVRTRLFVTDISRWQEYARAHGDVFRDFPPVTTMVEVKALIAPELLVEIEADARVSMEPS